MLLPGAVQTDRELEEHTLTLLKLVRSALIYLSSAVAHEEDEKSKSLDSARATPVPFICTEAVQFKGPVTGTSRLADLIEIAFESNKRSAVMPNYGMLGFFAFPLAQPIDA